MVFLCKLSAARCYTQFCLFFSDLHFCLTCRFAAAKKLLEIGSAPDKGSLQTSPRLTLLRWSRSSFRWRGRGWCLESCNCQRCLLNPGLVTIGYLFTFTGFFWTFFRNCHQLKLAKPWVFFWKFLEFFWKFLEFIQKNGISSPYSLNFPHFKL